MRDTGSSRSINASMFRHTTLLQSAHGGFTRYCLFLALQGIAPLLSIMPNNDIKKGKSTISFNMIIVPLLSIVPNNDFNKGKSIVSLINVSDLTFNLPVLNISPTNAEATFVQSTRMQRFFLKPSKPCHVGIHWIGLTEYSQMSTHVPGSVFRNILHWPNLLLISAA